MGSLEESDGVETKALADIDQVVEVTFRYPVRFTHGLLRPENTILRDVVEAKAAPACCS